MSTDADIIRRSVGEPAAFAELFDLHARAVAAFATRRVGADAAQDVLSETMLVAFRRRAVFDTSWESARPWLLGIASRIVKRHRALEAAQWRSFQASVARDDHVSDGQIDAASARTDAAAAVRELAPRIAALSVRDRETLLLYAWGDLTYEEVALALGVPVGTVRSRLNRVRRKLAPPGTGTGTATLLDWMAKEETNGHLGTGA